MTDDKRLKICEMTDNLLPSSTVATFTGQNITKLNVTSLGNNSESMV